MRSITRHTRLLLVFYYLLAEVWGMRCIWYWEASPLDIFVPVALAIALGWWAVVDAKHRGHAIPFAAQPWFVLLAAILVPGYIVWSRRWRGLGWLALHVSLWLLLATLILNVGGVIVFGSEW